MIGAGGIGSWFCEKLDKMIDAGQLLPHVNNTTQVTVYDPDVVEKKNMRHQQFYEGEEGMGKAEIMHIRFEFDWKMLRFGQLQLTSHNYYIICADNVGVRKTIYEHVLLSNSGGKMMKKFIDMRAEGKMYSIFTHTCSRERLMASLGDDPDSIEGFSCQLPGDVVIGHVNLAHCAAAVAGLQILLDDFRGGRIPASYVQDVVRRAA